ncbi:hypothetical protein B0H15DRAFT_571421 [Mycena belliarum]|uniref:Uncharacterized protein n=1 Tax=Mycena belliarum TaxID=1033014 RepID=A0AAD6TTR7_9AGAR|nr:hypothetical protein B0H15DRAFT_571421 [Mycena belliae]
MSRQRLGCRARCTESLGAPMRFTVLSTLFPARCSTCGSRPSSLSLAIPASLHRVLRFSRFSLRLLLRCHGTISWMSQGLLAFNFESLGIGITAALPRPSRIILIQPLRATPNISCIYGPYTGFMECVSFVPLPEPYNPSWDADCLCARVAAQLTGRFHESPALHVNGICVSSCLPLISTSASLGPCICPQICLRRAYSGGFLSLSSASSSISILFPSIPPRRPPPASTFLISELLMDDSCQLKLISLKIHAA